MMDRDQSRGRWVVGVALAALALLVAVGLWQTGGGGGGAGEPLVRRPRAIMGTDSTLVAVAGPGGRPAAEAALDEAEARLRRVEALMSNWIEDSEISKFNRAGAGREVALSPATRAVMAAARRAFDETGGAFDVTCRPLIELWMRAGEAGRLPDEAEIAAARAESNWEAIELTEAGAVKRVATARVDLGGIAKGYGIDLALAALREAGVAAGMVEVGGDLAVFGAPPEHEGWRVAIRDPFELERELGAVRLDAGAVCTSGNYARFVEIEGHRFSHIIDPRVGRPAESVPSVTVLAPEALTADIWATALSVLGREGMSKLAGEGREVLLITPERELIGFGSRLGALVE